MIRRTVCTAWVVLALSSGCVTQSSESDGPRAPVDIEAEAARVRSEFETTRDDEVRRRCLEALCVNLPPARAFHEICDLLAALDGERRASPEATTELVIHAGNVLFGVFSSSADPDPRALFERAFVTFETGTSSNARHLGWLLAATGAARGAYELGAARIERVLVSYDDSLVLPLVFGNLGQCPDRDVVGRILRRELHAHRDRPGELAYPGLPLAIAGFDSVLARERWLREEFDTLPANHPTRLRCSDVESMPNSTEEFVDELVKVGEDVELTEYDMLLICTFFAQYDARGIIKLRNARVPYGRRETGAELNKWYRKVERAVRGR